MHPCTPPLVTERPRVPRGSPGESPEVSAVQGTGPTGDTAQGSSRALLRKSSRDTAEAGSRKGSKGQRERKKRGAGDIGGLQLRDNDLLELGEEYCSEEAVAGLVRRIERYIVA
jgi:hypothetical protein